MAPIRSLCIVPERDGARWFPFEVTSKVIRGIESSLLKHPRQGVNVACLASCF
jgi:hypothetical protein